MAGHYFYDPRPFYGHDGSNGLMPLDELFYGRYEPVPYWMDQRMVPVPTFDDYYPGQKHAAMARGLPQLQQYAYKRPESRDDIGVDMYKRSPYNFNGVAMPMPGYGGQQQRQSYDDTWVHAMTPFGPAQQHGNMPRSGADQYRQMPGQMEVPMGYSMPSGNTNGNRGVEMPVNNGHMSNKGSTMGHSGNTMGHSGNTMQNMHNMHNMHNPNNPNNMGSNGNDGNSGSRMPGSMGNSGSNHGSQGSKPMGGSGHQFGNKSSGGYGNGYGHGYENVKSSSAGGKSMNAKMHGSQSSQRYGDDDSSADDSDDDYVKGGNNGMKWATKGSAKHGNGHPSFSQIKSGSTGGHGYDSVSSQHKKSGGHHGRSKSGGGAQSMISKILRFGADSSSSDSEDEGYGRSKSKASKGSSKMGGLHGSHGSLQSYGHPQLQSKQTPYGSSHSKSVELKVPICCENCEKKVRDCLKYMDGVENVLCDQWNRKVIVYGNVKAESVLKRVRKVKKGSELWQQGKQQQQQQQLRVY